MITLPMGQDSVEILRIKNDVNGNPRYVVHFADMESFEFRFYARVSMTLPQRYARVAKLANKLGGKKYTGKDFLGGIVFQAYEFQIPELIRKIQSMEN